MTIFFCSWLSNDTSTNSYGLYRLNKGTQLSDLWIDQDRNPKGPFTKMNIPMLAIIHLRLPWVPWPLSPSYNDGHNLYLWRSSTSRHKRRCKDPLAPWLRIPWLGEKSRADTLGPPIGSQLACPLRRSRAWAVFLSTISIWGKWILTKLEEWLSWGKSQVIYRQCPVVMRSVETVHSCLVFCKR